MAAISIGRKKAILMGSTSVLKTLIPPLPPPSVFASSSSSSSIIIRRRRTTTTTTTRCSSSSSLANGAAVSRSDIITSHTAKWMQDTSVKSPMQLINEVPPIKVEGRIVACEGDSNPALGHPIEFICLDLDEPAICKYCGLRYVQDHGSHHH